MTWWQTYYDQAMGSDSSSPYDSAPESGGSGEGGASSVSQEGTEGAPPWTAADVEASMPAPEPYDATAIDDSDRMGKLEAALTSGEVTGFKNSQEMIDQILAAADGRPLGTVSVVDHGTPGAQQMGDEIITWTKLQDPETAAAFEKLGAAFGPDGKIDLKGCQVAQGTAGEALLKNMARLTHVPVKAGVPMQWTYPGYEGSTLTCFPPTGTNLDGTPDQKCELDYHPDADSFWNWMAN